MRRHKWGPIAALLIQAQGIANGRVAVTAPIAPALVGFVSCGFARVPDIWWVAKKPVEKPPTKRKLRSGPC